MKNILSLLLILCSGFSFAQKNPNIRLNHLLIVVDSSTYSSMCASEFIMNELGYSNEKKFKDWEGLYINGLNNYLEIFHPNSIKHTPQIKGANWSCFASMQAGYLEQVLYNTDYIKYGEDEYIKALGLELNDSLSPFEIWEMKALQYETWTKKWTQKDFEEGMRFNPVDYNSPADADSAKNYLLQDIIGVAYTIPLKDSTKAVDFFQMAGYTIKEKTTNKVVFDNSIEEFTLLFEPGIANVSINSIKLRLNKIFGQHEYSIGSTKLNINDNIAMWYFY